MISIKSKVECCGCSACFSICPRNSIKMNKDSEGFQYPIVDIERCTNCGLCERVCPIIKAKSEGILCEECNKEAFIVQHRDKNILKDSTSGGFFSALCSYVLKNNGIVFGAAYDENFKIRHTWISDERDLNKFRNSKYTQSEIGDAFKECKKFLIENKLVCFSGTPCQIAGLKSYLNKEYTNLISVDVVCRGVPSPYLFEKYIEWLGGGQSIDTIKFRDKFYGYFCSTMSVYYRNGKVMRRDIHTDPMLSFFFQDYCSRPSCHSCAFKTIDRISDFTMFDCWHANMFNKSFGKLGATALVVHNNKAKEVLNYVSDYLKICIPVNVELLISLDGSMFTQSVSPNPKKELFFMDLEKYGFEYVLHKYHRVTIKNSIKNSIKIFLMKTGIFNKIMHYKFKK